MCADITRERGGYTAAFFTLGCRVNQYETQAMREQFEKLGFKVFPFDEKASPCDAYIINTCTVTAESDRKCRNMIRRAAELAKQKAADPGISHAGAVVAVCGCYSQSKAAEICSIDGVSLVMGNEGKGEMARLCLDILEGRIKSSTLPLCKVTDISESKACEKMSITFSERTRAYVKIVDGCDNKCTYCIIPSVRGHVRSRDHADIVSEVENLANCSYKEVVLTGIETASYGMDTEKRKGEALISLVTDISRIEGIQRIRFGSLEPTLFTEDFASKLASIPKVMPHFHLSLQSGSSDVLALMKRKYNADMFLKSVSNIRRNFKDVTITTDIIAGFPGETEENFAESARMIEAAGFCYAHIFPYSRRDGTPASTMVGQLTMAEKKRRVSELNRVMMQKRREILTSFIGKTVKVLVETTVSHSDGKVYATGHSENFIEFRVPYFQGVTEENEIVDVMIDGISEDGMELVGYALQ